MLLIVVFFDFGYCLLIFATCCYFVVILLTCVNVCLFFVIFVSVGCVFLFCFFVAIVVDIFVDVTLLTVWHEGKKLWKNYQLMSVLQRKKNEVAADIKKTKEDLQKARMEGAIPKAKKYAPKFNKDTKVKKFLVSLYLQSISQSGQSWHEHVDHPQLHERGAGGIRP